MASSYDEGWSLEEWAATFADDEDWQAQHQLTDAGWVRRRGTTVARWEPFARPYYTEVQLPDKDVIDRLLAGRYSPSHQILDDLYKYD